MDNKNVVVTNESELFSNGIEIQNMIYLVRGKQVMLDGDLAFLYQVETKRLNEAVKRNIERFPDRFRFQLTKEEYENLKSQIATSSLGETDNNYGGRRKLPYAFTEQGIAMLSAVLRSEVAVQVSLRIMDTFVELKRYLANTSALCDRISSMEARQIVFEEKTNRQLEQVFQYIADHEEDNQKIFFDGQIFDAFSLLTSLIQQADKSIVLIDGYADAGKKCFAINKIEDVGVINDLIRRAVLTS